MNATSQLLTVFNWVMMTILILVFGGAGLWCLINPDGYIGTMGVIIGSDLGRPEIRAIGGMYFLSGFLGFVACLKQGWLLDAYKALTFVLVGILVARAFTFASGNFHQLIVIYAVLEIVFVAHTIHRLRQLT